jgi:hypothetical protein
MRTCIRCGDVITACMGFVLARDMLAAEAGKTTEVREHCGKCTLWLSLQPDEGRAYFQDLSWL